MLNARDKFLRRKTRNRVKLAASNEAAMPRLSVFRSRNNIYAQIIDDAKRQTIVAASTLDKSLRGKLKSSGNKDAAETVGKLIAEKAIASGIKSVVFDRGGYLYHGRVKALAEAARSSGLKF
ncbi:50S ribosomal protein L18 [Candidatus Nucleicultrix amoebiphila]|jgi:large subunit ribosomal protein L18|uniref:Large ribosomal subunit protein uL18 n=1 Tax=Candidatus Nucleicultrix amoebiphila FS5 TaxID=1414854 RepID=A0A1W6N6B8_9PROT|nr:50S ribosomal protein L18 [Candidatus Nucleicultrix amoebiphila]ARN85338.1 50S ribosomal protein L18 [Candidatus Nucleicultrix amoebiphila FS5]